MHSHSLSCTQVQGKPNKIKIKKEKKKMMKMYASERLVTRFENGEYIVHNECVGLDVFHGTYDEVKKFINDYFDEIDSY